MIRTHSLVKTEAGTRQHRSPATSATTVRSAFPRLATRANARPASDARCRVREAANGQKSRKKDRAGPLRQGRPGIKIR